MFQSIFTRNGYWNFSFDTFNNVFIHVSIHLHPQWALESVVLLIFISVQVSFNPSSPAMGIGIGVFVPCPFWRDEFQSIFTRNGHWNQWTSKARNYGKHVSIHLHPQWALELTFFFASAAS